MNRTDKQPEIIEAEIIDEHGRTVVPQPDGDHPRPHARPKGDKGGLVGGFFVLAFGFMVTLFVAAFTIFIVLPLALIGRIFGMQLKTPRA